MNRVGHCSALIKLTDDMSDVFLSHNSWFEYSAMLRIYKTYVWKLSDSAVNTTSFSSYPGMIRYSPRSPADAETLIERVCAQLVG